jgi:CBS domain-containing protein
VVTDRDLVIRMMADPLRDDATPTHRVMSMPAVTCAPEDDLATLGEIIAKSKKSRIVVVNGSGRCLGMIGLFEIGQTYPERARDLLRAIARPEGAISLGDGSERGLLPR